MTPSFIEKKAGVPARPIRRRRWPAAAAVLCLLGALAALAYFYRPSLFKLQDAEQPRPHLPEMRGDWVPVKRGNFEIACHEEGELRPVVVTSLTFLLPGKLGFMIPEGTYVHKGERVMALETTDLELEIQTIREDLSAAELTLSQAEQTRELEIKRLSDEAKTTKEQAEFAILKRTDILAHPNDVEKEEAQNDIDSAVTKLSAAEQDVELTRPLVEKGFGSRQDLDTKVNAVEKARIEHTHAGLKSRILLAGALPADRTRADLDVEYGVHDIKAKEFDNEDQINALTLKVKVAERAARAAQRKLDKRKLDLVHSTVHAPHEGVIVYRQMMYRANKKPEVGERVSPWIAPVDLPNYEKMKVRTQVPESLIRKIHAREPKTDAAPAKPGSKARVVVQTLPWLVFDAEVTWIDGWARDRNSKLSDADIKAQGLSGVKVFDVEVELSASDPKHLREGFRAAVDFPEEVLKDVIAVPITAVSTIDGVSYVTTYDNGWPAPRAIVLGRSSNGKVVITSGLKDTDKVFVPKLIEPPKETEAAPAAEKDAKKAAGPRGGRAPSNPSGPGKEGGHER